MRLVVDDTFNRIQKLILSRTVVQTIKIPSNEGKGYTHHARI